jgi:hypothetical protein
LNQDLQALPETDVLKPAVDSMVKAGKFTPDQAQVVVRRRVNIVGRKLEWNPNQKRLIRDGLSAQRGHVIMGEGFGGGGKTLCSVGQADIVQMNGGCTITLVHSHAAGDAIVERVIQYNKMTGGNLKPLRMYRLTNDTTARNKRGKVFDPCPERTINDRIEELIFLVALKYKENIYSQQYGKPDYSLEAQTYQKAVVEQTPAMGSYPSPAIQEQSQARAKVVYDSDGKKHKVSNDQAAALPAVDMSAELRKFFDMQKAEPDLNKWHEQDKKNFLTA